MHEFNKYLIGVLLLFPFSLWNILNRLHMESLFKHSYASTQWIYLIKMYKLFIPFDSLINNLFFVLKMKMCLDSSYTARISGKGKSKFNWMEKLKSLNPMKNILCYQSNNQTMARSFPGALNRSGKHVHVIGIQMESSVTCVSSCVCTQLQCLCQAIDEIIISSDYWFDKL